MALIEQWSLPSMPVTVAVVVGLTAFLFWLPLFVSGRATRRRLDRMMDDLRYVQKLLEQQVEHLKAGEERQVSRARTPIPELRLDEDLSQVTEDPTPAPRARPSRELDLGEVERDVPPGLQAPVRRKARTRGRR